MMQDQERVSAFTPLSPNGLHISSESRRPLHSGLPSHSFVQLPNSSLQSSLPSSPISSTTSSTTPSPFSSNVLLPNSSSSSSAVSPSPSSILQTPPLDRLTFEESIHDPSALNRPKRLRSNLRELNPTPATLPLLDIAPYPQRAIPTTLQLHHLPESSQTASLTENAPSVLASTTRGKSRRKRPTNQDTRISPNPKITSCEHKFREHYAKGFCYYCYEHIRSTPTETRCTPNPKIVNCPHYTREHHAKGMCSSCYEHHRGPFRATKANYTLESPNPKITSCEHVLKEHQAKGFCHQCYRVASNKKRRERFQIRNPSMGEVPVDQMIDQDYDYLPTQLVNPPQFMDSTSHYRDHPVVHRDLVHIPHGSGFLSHALLHEPYLHAGQQPDMSHLHHPPALPHLLHPQMEMYTMHLPQDNDVTHGFSRADPHLHLRQPQHLPLPSHIIVHDQQQSHQLNSEYHQVASPASHSDQLLQHPYPESSPSSGTPTGSSGPILPHLTISSLHQQSVHPTMQYHHVDYRHHGV